MEIHEGGHGGRLGKDGMDAVDTLYANTRNNPVEDIEARVPLRINSYELIEDRSGRRALAWPPWLNAGSHDRRRRPHQC